MKNSRLFKIVYHLINNNHTTASILAEDFDVSTRTIYRDIDALSEAGIPIYSEAGRNGGISLMENFTLDKVMFSDTEKRELLHSLKSLSVVNNTSDNDATNKLSALFNIDDANWFEVDFSRCGSSSDTERFNLIKGAMIKHNTLKISYVDSYGKTSKREINPIQFLYKSKEWYVKSYCLKKSDFRIFKFNRIIDLEITSKSFEPTTYPKVEELENKTYNEIVLKFSKNISHRVYDEFDVNDVKEEDNHLIVSVKFPEDYWVVGYLLSYGSFVEVISPTSLRKTLEEEGKKIYEMYKC